MMRNLIWIFCFFPFLTLGQGLFFEPDLYQDKAVFTFEDDLWLADLSTQRVERITNHPGKETFAKFSPDGKTLAFTGHYDGGWDVYLLNLETRNLQRLTYHPSYERVQGFTPDGAYVLFTAFRERYYRLYRVPIAGGFPELVPVDRAWYATQNAKGKVAYNRYRADRMNWKGYKGGQQQDIWLWDPSQNHFSRLTTYNGYDNRPMWYGDNLYFVSDRAGRMNLYQYDFAKDTAIALTHHTTWDVQMASMDESTGRIIYFLGGYLHIFDTQTQEDRQLQLSIPSELWQKRSFEVAPKDYLHSIHPGVDGEKSVVEARGDIFLIDKTLEEVKNLTQTSDIREMEPALSPDGKKVAFFSDKSGEYELYLLNLETQELTQCTQGSHTYYYHLLWSPDGKKILFGDKDYKIFVYLIPSKERLLIDDGQYLKDDEIFWEVSDYHFSPDSQWVAYSLPQRNRNNAIFLYSLKDRKRYPLTDGYFDDYSPVFDESGRYLYFLSHRNFQPLLDPFMDNHVNFHTTTLMMVQLQKGEPLPYYPQWKKHLKDLKKEEKPQVTIHWEGIQNRIFQLPLKAGTYKDLEAGFLKVYFLSKENFGFPGMEAFFHPKSVRDYNLQSYDIKEDKTKTLIKGIGYYRFSHDGKKIAYLSGKTAGVVDAGKKAKVGDGKLQWYGFPYIVNPEAEFRQILKDVWRQIRDFFYDPDIHGKDWEGMYKKYETLLPYVGTRGDINFLIGELIGELTASHEYIVGRGGPLREKADRIPTGLLGADIQWDEEKQKFVLSHILRGLPYRKDAFSPLQQLGVSDGTYLLAIDGKSLKKGDNPYALLVGKAGQPITLTLSEDGKKQRKVTLRGLFSEYNLRYVDWVLRNREFVEKATDGKIGYIHLADMDEVGIRQFEEAFRALRYKDGLILDVRGNRGGFVSYFIIDKLERKLQYLSVTRDFQPMAYPHGVALGPLVVLCDANTASDGEVFTQHFKDLKLGTVIGERTWGGLIGIINMIPLLDGGMVTQSNVGFSNLKGEWIVENHGAEPDIFISISPEDFLQGKDPQLEKALEVLQDNLKKHPLRKLTPPPFPKK